MKIPSKILIVLAGVGLVGIILFAAKYPSPSANSVSVPAEHKVTQNSSLTPDEETQIDTAANAMVKANTEEGYTYTLSIRKHVGDYVRVDVTPGKNEMIDPAQVILQKQEGIWKAVTFGTSFPDMYQKVPELFQ